jgi:hypothetical protein
MSQIHKHEWIPSMYLCTKHDWNPSMYVLCALFVNIVKEFTGAKYN